MVCIQTIIYNVTKKKKSNNGFNPRKKTKVISPSGSGGIIGGKKAPKRPKEVSNSGYSNANIQILAALSEGTIGSLVSGAKSIFIDDTPVENADGTGNFTGFTYDGRNGTQEQTCIPGFADSINSETTIGSEVVYNIPITRQIINKNLDAIIVRLGFVLQEYPEAGGVLGSNITFRISIKEGNGAFVNRYEQNLSGRYASLTEFEYKFPVNNIGGTVDNFSVRVERLSPTETNLDRVQKQVTFQTYIEAIETKLRYPNTALIAIKLEASQFTSTPKFTFDVYGRLIAIPTISSVAADGGLNFAGVWDGSFYNPTSANQACADPAWILWDLLTNKRYGLGNQIKVENLDKWSFLAISKYCNEFVPNGEGGFERRFSANFVLEGKEDAYKVIEAIRSIFKGFSYFLNGALSFAADMPGTPVMQFTQADIEDGMFSYSRTGLKARHTVAVVTWIDPSDNYNRVIETVEDAEAISMFGVREIEISAFAATTRGQARRAGLSILLTEKLELETVTFKVRAFGNFCTPGMIIKVADSKRADIRYGGLITAYDYNYIDVDSPVTLNVGESYQITVMQENGKIEERNITNPPGVHTRIYISDLVQDAWSSSPIIEGNWIISSANVQPQLFRVLNRSVVAGSEDTMYEITALQYEPSKYAAIELDYELEPRPTRIKAPLVVSPPENVTATVALVGNQYILTADWTPPYIGGLRDQFVTSYLIEYRVSVDSNWIGTTSTANSYQEYIVAGGENYFVRVASVDLSGNSSIWVEDGI